MALITLIRDLHRRKARERRGMALAEGVRLVEELIDSGLRCRGALVSSSLESTPRGRELVSLMITSGLEPEHVSDVELEDLASTENPQGVIVVFEPRDWRIENLVPAPGKPIVVLDALQDPGNVGTIARTAAAFGAAGVLALPGTADLNNPKVQRAAAGALFNLPNLSLDMMGLLQFCRAREVEVWVGAMDGESITEVDCRDSARKVAIVLGNEGAGVSDQLLQAAERRIGIPIEPVAESLNVAVAAGILLHHLGSK